MKYIVLITAIFVFIGCKNNEDKAETLKNSYEAGIQNYINIKKENPSNFLATQDCMIGSRLPNFKAETIDGKKIDTQMLKGKVSVLNFWFTTCKPCVAEIPGFNEIVETYGADKVNFISFGKNKKEEIEKFLQKHAWTFSHVSNEDDIIGEKFKIQFGYPTTYIVNKEGIIVTSFFGGAVGEQATAVIKNKIMPILDKEI